MSSQSSEKPEKNQKRVLQNEPLQREEYISRLIIQYQASAKKKKIETKAAKGKEFMKILDLVNHQSEARRNCNNILFQNLKEITNQLEANYNVMKENEQKLEHMTSIFMKCIQQATAAYKHKLKMLKDIQIDFKKECEELETDHKAETEILVDELEYDIKKLQEKLVTETKRSGWESLRRSIFLAMQNDF